MPSTRKLNGLLRIPSRVTQQIVNRRKELGLTLEQVADAVPIKTATYRMLETGADGGQPKIPRSKMIALLQFLQVPEKLRRQLMRPYYFGELLEQSIQASGRQKVEVARYFNNTGGWTTKLISGTLLPRDADMVYRLAEFLDLSRTETSGLMEAAGFKIDFLHLSEPSSRGQEAVAHLLSAVRRFITEQTYYQPPKRITFKGIFQPRRGVRRRSAVIRSTDQLLFNASELEVSDHQIVRIALGSIFSPGDSQSLEPIRHSVENLLGLGVTVRVLIERRPDPMQSALLVSDFLQYCGRRSGIDVRMFDPDDVIDTPMRGVQIGDDQTLIIFPEEHQEEHLSAHWFSDRSHIFRDHFERRFQAARPLFRYFGHHISRHCALEESLFEAESTSGSRFVVKPDINGLMVPPECRGWEREYLARKYSLGDLEAASDTFSSIFESREKRVANFEYLASQERCADICCRETFKEFFKPDSPGVRDKSATLDDRVRVLNRIIYWLQETNYQLALADQWDLDQVAFEVTADNSAVVQTWLEKESRNCHLQLFEPTLVQAFEGYFRSIWSQLRREEKDKKYVLPALEALRRGLLGE